MKCPNCGYNCDDKYCAMCGTKMPEQPVNTNPNPYESAPVSNNFQPESFNQPNNAGFNSGFGNNNPYNQPQSPVNNPNTYYQPQPPVNDTNPFQNDFQSGIPNMPQGNMPVPPAYPAAPPQYSSTPKKKSKALPIIISCLIAAVIVSGAVISVYSACTYNQSIFTDLFNDDNDDYYFDDEYYPSSDYEYIEDTDKHKIGEAKELPDCKVTLKRVEKDKSAEESKTGSSRTKYVFEIENTTDKYITLNYIYCDAYNTDTDTFLEWLSNNLDSDYVSLDPNQKKEITFDYSVPNNAESVELYLSITGDGDKYEYYGTFVAE